jgi:hypothetical protein
MTKKCPILQAGLMLNGIMVKTSSVSVSSYSEMTHRFTENHPPTCMKSGCEWYKNGCPAHPKKGK